MTFEDCLEKGLIKRSESAGERVKQSLSLGDKFLKSAERNFEMGENEVCEIIAYNALFHYARALLFSKGYIERSHACLFLALKKLYPRQETLFGQADKMRIERHNLQYSGLAANETSAELALKIARDFGDAAKQLLD